MKHRALPFNDVRVMRIWDNSNYWVLDTVAVSPGEPPRQPPHIPPDQVLFRAYQLSFAITGVWSW